MPKKPLKKYVLFQGNRKLYTGTVPEIAEFHDIEEQTVRYYTSPAYKKTVEISKKPEDRLIVIALDNAEEISNRTHYSP